MKNNNKKETKRYRLYIAHLYIVASVANLLQ